MNQIIDCFDRAGARVACVYSTLPRPGEVLKVRRSKKGQRHLYRYFLVETAEPARHPYRFPDAPRPARVIVREVDSPEEAKG